LTQQRIAGDAERRLGRGQVDLGACRGAGQQTIGGIVDQQPQQERACARIGHRHPGADAGLERLVAERVGEHTDLGLVVDLAVALLRHPQIETHAVDRHERQHRSASLHPFAGLGVFLGDDAGKRRR
jgi:hypothetical protein